MANRKLDSATSYKDTSKDFEKNIEEKNWVKNCKQIHRREILFKLYPSGWNLKKMWSHSGGHTTGFRHFYP